MSSLQVEKNLLTEEDIAYGEGLLVQQRQGIQFNLSKVRGFYPVNSVEELNALDPVKHPKAVLCSSNAAIFYSYIAGAWVKLDPDGVFADLANATDPAKGAALVGRSVETFDSVADMSAASLVVGKQYKTLGYYTPDDGGGALYIGKPLGYVARSYADHVSASSVVAALVADDEVKIEQWGARPDYNPSTKTGTDNLPMLQAIRSYVASLPYSPLWASGEQIAEGIKITSGSGAFGLSATMDWGTVSVNLDFAGLFQTVFAALSGFAANTPIFRLGSKASQVLTKQVSLKSCSFNCAGIAGVRGFEFYGIRDGSVIKDIFISGFTGTAVYSDFAGQAGGAFMSQGVLLDNVQALSFVHTSGVIFDIGGLFESIIFGGKALLNGLARAGETIGYRIGHTECRGVSLQSVSVGNLLGTGGKVGIAYENAIDCWDNECTLENIQGIEVQFGRTQTASLCKSIMARHYNPAAISQKAYEFKLANTCTCTMGNASASVTAVTFEAGSSNSHAEIKLVNGAISAIKATTVLFNGGSGNSAKGYSSVDAAYWGLTGTDVSADIWANGTSFRHDQFWSTIQFGAQNNKLRFRNSAGTVLMTVNGTTGEVTIDTNLIKMASLPSTPGSAGYLYKDGSGFVKIG